MNDLSPRMNDLSKAPLLVLNCGSSSIKFALYEAHGGEVPRRPAWVGKIDKPLASHIHKGAAGTAGPVVVPLGAAYKAKGCTKAPAKVVAAIEEHPSSYYVNIHTTKYPAGAIRGQLVVGMLKG